MIKSKGPYHMSNWPWGDSGASRHDEGAAGAIITLLVRTARLPEAGAFSGVCVELWHV